MFRRNITGGMTGGRAGGWAESRSEAHVSVKTVGAGCTVFVMTMDMYFFFLFIPHLPSSLVSHPQPPSHIVLLFSLSSVPDSYTPLSLKAVSWLNSASLLTHLRLLVTHAVHSCTIQARLVVVILYSLVLSSFTLRLNQNFPWLLHWTTVSALCSDPWTSFEWSSLTPLTHRSTLAHIVQ